MKQESRKQSLEIEFRETKNSAEENSWLKTVLTEAFPKDERPPFSFLRERMIEHVEWLIIIAEGEKAGFVYLMSDDEQVYLFYLAMDRKMRGKYIGTQALLKLIERYPDKNFFLAIEPVDESLPDYQQRLKRKNFYLNCGLRETGQRVREGKVIFDILSTRGRVNPQKYEKMMADWLGNAFPAPARARMFE